MNDLFRKIKDLSEKYNASTINNLSRLVQIKSLSCQEKDLTRELKMQMESSGADEVIIDGLGNVIGKLGIGRRILAIDGHIDTVDTGNLDNWDSDPFSGKVENGFVWGRGSVDQKGGVASMVTAIRILKEIGIPDDLTVYFVGSVIEEDCDGLCWKYIIEEDRIIPHAVILTEPTNLKIYRGQRGRIEIRIKFKGLSAHGSAPERGKNAIYTASRAALEIEKLNERLGADDFLGKGSITISEFRSGSPSLCAVADFSQLHVDRRLTWGETEASAISELEAIIKGMDATIEVPEYSETAFTGLNYGMKKYYPTWKLEMNHSAVATAVKAFEGLYQQKPGIDKWTFSTNGVTINGIYKIPAIGFGPGSEEMAHAPNERIPVGDLSVASAFYAAYALAFNENK
jgi:putative selenium metabolism hydrolase